MKVSIITINYNNALGLENTIRSVVDQTCNDYEYIIIDGNSTDGSVDVIKKYSDKITYWVSEPDSGIYNAMNKGIKKASGDYLLFLNSGDIIKPTVDLCTCVKKLSGEEDLVIFNLEINDLQKTYTNKYNVELDFSFFIDNALPHQSTFIKRSRLTVYGGYNESLKIASDWTFFIDAICKLNCSYKYVDSDLSIFYFDGISSLEENRNLSLKERELHIQNNYRPYLQLYREWREQKNELHKLRMSRSIGWLKKLGFIKWFNTYK